MPAGGTTRDQVVHGQLRVLLARRVVGLVADGLDSPVDALAARWRRMIASTGSPPAMSTGSAPISVGEGEAVGLLVDDEDARRAPDEGAVGRHEPDRAGAEDGDPVAGADARQLGAVVAGGEDVREHGEVELVLVAGRQPGSSSRRRAPAGTRPARRGTAPSSRSRTRRRRCPRSGCAEAEAPVAGLAVAAGAAGDVEGHRDAVADLDALDRRADLLDDRPCSRGRGPCPPPRRSGPRTCAGRSRRCSSW